MFGKTMKNKLYIIFMIIVTLHSYSLVNASMSTKDRIAQIEVACAQEIAVHIKSCWSCQSKNRRLRGGWCRVDIQEKFDQLVAIQAMGAHDLTHLEKLNHLSADAYFEPRKEIIKNMIKQGAHPDAIVYHVDNTTPMKESILHKDDIFKNFLIEHGATQK